MLIMKELLRCGKETNERLKVLDGNGERDSEEYRLLYKKLMALIELRNFAYNGNWTRESSREKFTALAKSKFDYNLIAERYGTTRKSLDVFTTRQDKRLSRAIGRALELIKLNDVDAAMCCFQADNGVLLPDKFRYCVYDLLPRQEKKDSITVEDCRDEIELLRLLAKENIQEFIKAVDSSKLAHLMFLLQTEEPAYRQQKTELIRKLTL